MKPLTWDSGCRWDDPNARWGDPSYLLEPGDSGYTPPPAPPDSLPSVPKKRTKNTMPKSDYILQNDEQFAAQLKTFKTGIGAYATLVAVSPAQVTAQAADADYMAYLAQSQGIAQAAAQQWTAWKNMASAGGTVPPSGAPVAPVFPAAVAAVPPGIEVRFRALVKQIKANANYNAAIGEALGIEGSVQGRPDLSGLQPAITATLTGNHVFIGWGWGGNSAFLDLLEIQVDRADGKGWAFLTYDSTPNYADTAPFPATPTKWKYRAIYRVADAQVGVWSNTVEITVG
jgi:hypothetical protein